MRIAGLLILWTFIFALNTQGQNCTADFSYESNGLTFTFTDLSTSSDGTPITSWSWNFDDGTTSNQQNPTHTFPDIDNYNVCLTITTQGGCTSTQFCLEVEVCELSLNVVMGNCDPNGNIPIDITISDPFDQAKEIDVFIDGNLVPGSPFDIDDNAPVMLSSEVPGDGLVHTVRAQSLNIGSCMSIDSLNVPDCNSNCFLSSMSVNIANASTHTVSVGDNFFNPSNASIIVGDIVEWNWTGSGHTSTSDATSGPDSWNSGELNAPASFSHQFQTAGTHNYYCIPHGGPGGVGMSGVIISNCPGGSNTIDYEINFSTSQANSAGFNLYIDGSLEAGSPYSYSGTGPNTLSIQLPGDGSLKTLMIEDVNDPSCTISRDVQTPDCGAAPSCSITLNAAQGGACNNNMVPYDITVNDINGGNNFSVSIDGSAAPGSPFSYSPSGMTTITLQIPGDGQSHTIEVVDGADPNCSNTIQVTSPDCSVPCSISGLQISTGQPAIHTIDVADFEFIPQNLSITQGDTVEFIWTGAVQHTSTSDASSGPDSWDSGLLGSGATFRTPILSLGNHPYYCIPHGAQGGVGMSGTISVNPDCTNGMVTGTLNFSSSGTGFNGFNVLVDGNVTAGSPYAYDPTGNQSVVISMPGDGQSHLIEVVDADNPSCSGSINFTTTDCNQTAPCELNLTATPTSNCMNNEVSVDLTITNINSGNQFQVFLDGNAVPGNPYTYNGSGNTQLSIQVPGDGASHTIEIADIADPTCSATATFNTVDCSLPCTISGLQLSSGQSVRHTIEVADFEFIPQNISITEGDTIEFVWTGAVEHTATSDASSGPNSWDSGLLGNGAVFEAPILSAGNHPYYCIPHGGPGGVGMSGNINVNPNCENGMQSATLLFNSSGTGSGGYQVVIDGSPTPNGPYAYNPSGMNTVSILLPGDGQSHSIEISDVNNPSCSANIDIITSNCSAGANCELTAVAALGGPCNNNDEIPVELTITNSNSGNSFNVFINGSLSTSSPYNYQASGTTTLSVLVPGNGQTHTIEVVDTDSSMCTASTTISVPNCNSGNCTIENLNISTDQPVRHTIEVEDFSFEPEVLNITVGDTVHFIWTGQVTHTTTSDATSGPDSWDSGLLGNGAEFEVIIDSPGQHMYYCIPHGGPGGVGMAGLINANNNCNNGLVSINIFFESNRTQFESYNVLIDNVISGNSPYQYSPNSVNNISLSLAGDGQAHEVKVQDTQAPSCQASDSVQLSQCGGSPCNLELNNLGISNCLANDSFQVDLQILNLPSSSTGFNIYVNGNLHHLSPYSPPASGDTSVALILFGNGGTKTIEVRDIQQTNCSAIEVITAPICGDVCVLQDLMINTESNLKHRVEVRDYEFSPAQKTIVSSDSIEFLWTGDVEHTTTSDANSGPDSWDSGLLGNGATFSVAPTAEGDHPYYCIPHGGPGGIGMAGNIHVQPQCMGDTAYVSITFMAINAHSGYNIYLDGVKITDSIVSYDDPNGFNSYVFKILGDGLLHTLTLQDEQTPFCAISMNFTAPQCAPPCVINDLSVNKNSDILHYISVRDFDFAPKQIQVGTGETVRFVWTGDVDHTTTSDATSGPDTWDSGILGNGATYDIQLQTPGEHPYYCIPHGGPGGIGMAGNITALPNCENGQDKVQVEFDIRGGSTQGYNVFIDGIMIPGSPFPYENKNGINRKILYLPGDGQIHTITIQDKEVSFCAFSEQVEAQDCNTNCIFEDLSYTVGAASFDTVLVADFEFIPKNIQVKEGDTLIFDFIGDIAHTVTSDATSGLSIFNSGLLGNGAIYKLSLNEVGQHPYYCIPHGGPGGIGMAGNIEVVDECIDDSLLVQVNFSISGQSTAYNVYLKGELTPESPIVYEPGREQSFQLKLPANGNVFQLMIEDVQQTSCHINSNIEMPDCDDPCYPYQANFSELIDPALLEVQFNDRSSFDGDITYHWSFGDGNESNEKEPLHYYDRVGTYEVCLTITAQDSSCVDIYCKDIVVGKVSCEGDFIIQNDGLDVDLLASAQTNSAQTQYLWDFGDGTNGQGKQVYHAYDRLGEYDICLQILYDTCEVNICKTIDLTDSCLLLQSNFTSQTQSNDLTVQFNDQSRGNYTYRLWGFGDGSTSSELNPVHEYQQDGIYNVCLVLRNEQNGCSDYYCYEIEVGNVSSGSAVSGDRWTLYPNPADQRIQKVYLQSKRMNDTYNLNKICIVDMNGKTLLQERLDGNNSSGIIELRIHSSMAVGMYFVQLYTDSGIELHKLIIQ